MRWDPLIKMIPGEDMNKVDKGIQPRRDRPAANNIKIKIVLGGYQNFKIPKNRNNIHSGKPVCPPGLVPHPLHFFEQHISTTPEWRIDTGIFL